MGLLAVPRAAAGRAELRDEADEGIERGSGAAGGVHALFFIAEEFHGNPHPHVDAFVTDGVFTGNPAAVCPLAAGCPTR